MARRLLHALIIVLTLIVGATAAVAIVLQTAWFKNWLRVYIEREAHSRRAQGSGADLIFFFSY